jgi:soluble lytic murein transglycosylase-like protein
MVKQRLVGPGAVKNRQRMNYVLILAVTASVAGMLFQSCYQEQRVARSLESAPGRKKSSSLADQLKSHGLIDAEAFSTGDSGTVQKRIPDSLRPLDRSTERFIRNYGPAVKRYAVRYGVDWRFVLAIIQQESRYSHAAESRRGASGLMQLMPVTGVELSRKLEIEDMSHPEHNIQAGVFYLRNLYNLFDGAEEFDRLELTLAAYNAGFSRVHDAQDVAIHLLDKPNRWAAVRNALPLLSKQFYTLHRAVWGQDRPRSGWFGNARETIGYVDAVMGYYGTFKESLN